MSSEGSPLLPTLEAHGGVVSEYHGRRVVRHFGDPAAEYEAARTALAVFDRSHRARMRLSGRAPRQMLDGIVTGTLPAPPEPHPSGLTRGRARYSAVLTPKGKMVTDLWVLLTGDEEAVGFVLDVPVAGAEGLLEHFTKFLPPRFATVGDATQELGMISVVGPEAAARLAEGVLGGGVDADELAALEEGEWLADRSDDGAPTAVIRTGEVTPDAYNVLGPLDGVAAAFGALVDAGAKPAGLGVWATLRVEAGRPAFGTDMDEKTIPVEAGIHGRAIDQGKGCYTGQEVIVRIRDRGHVNRHLRQLRLGDVPAPAKGTELVAPGSDKPVAWITSAVESPAFGEVVALAYVRRGVETLVYEGREVAVPSE